METRLLQILLLLLFIVKPIFTAGLGFLGFLKSFKKEATADELLGQLLQQEPRKERLNKVSFSEVLIIGLAPLMGIVFSYSFMPLVKPFGLESLPSLNAFILLPWFSYWCSRLFKKRMSWPLFQMLPYGMAIGCLIFPLLGLHFLSGTTIAVAWIAGPLVLPLIAPIPACFYLIRELHAHRLLTEKRGSSLQLFRTFAIQPWLNQRAGLLFFTILLILVQVILQVFFEQRFYSLITAFTDGRDFLFSGILNFFF